MRKDDILVIIPARGGSKGLPGKNIRLLAGMPLLWYTIDTALKLFPVSNICLSSDSAEIIECARQRGLTAPFVRPEELATDSAKGYDVILHAVSFYRILGRSFSKVIILQPTSPFRRPEHIIEALELHSANVDIVLSVREADANPYFNLYEEDSSGRLVKSKELGCLNRQACPPVWQANGSIYIYNFVSLSEENRIDNPIIIKYQMAPEYSVDIDSLYDFMLAEFILNKNLLKNV
jgi:N-acylneuraminate cytidylyltransferase